MKPTHKALSDRILDAEIRAGKWLADGNEAFEAGNIARSEACYDKSQYWLDRANKLRGWN